MGGAELFIKRAFMFFATMTAISFLARLVSRLMESIITDFDTE